MADLSKFDPNAPGNPLNNIFGLPFTEEDAKLVLVPVPWEVTVSCGSGTARTAEHIKRASLQVDLLDYNEPHGWRQGIYMQDVNRKLLSKSDYLRKEAELYIDYISRGDELEKNKFMCKSINDINEGSKALNNWVYENTKSLLLAGKLVAVLGGDHSVTLGFVKALGEQHGKFGILQVDAHCDLRKRYERFMYSHASVMYNILNEIPEVERVLQIGVRDYCEEEWTYVCNSNYRVITYLDQRIKERQYEGETWKNITAEIINQLPEKVYLSLDVDGLDPKLCPNTGTPVPGGLETEHVYYLVKKIIESGRKLIGFDVVEIGNGEGGCDANTGAHLLWRLSNLLLKSNV